MRYFISVDIDPPMWIEVDRDQYIKTERAAGFRPKSGDGIATAGFSGGGGRGRVSYSDELPPTGTVVVEIGEEER